jgi:hypothetical protein
MNQDEREYRREVEQETEQKNFKPFRKHNAKKENKRDFRMLRREMRKLEGYHA